MLTTAAGLITPLPFGLKMHLTGRTGITHAYQDMLQTGSGTSGTNTITASASVATTSLVIGSRLIIGADTYTVSNIVTTTITTTTNLINNYVAATMQMDTVSGWASQAGFPTSGNQATAIDKPAFVPSGLNGRDVIDFNPTAKGLTTTAVAQADDIFATGGTLICVVNIDSVGETVGRILEKLNSTNNATWNLVTQNVTGSTCKLAFNQITSATAGAWVTTSVVLTFGTTAVITMTYNQAAPTVAPVIRVNGSVPALTNTVAPTGTANVDTGGTYNIGNRNGLDRGMDGRLATIAVWNRVLTAFEIGVAERYLAQIWGATLA